MLTPRDNLRNFMDGKPYDRVPSCLDLKRFLPDMIPSNVARGRVEQQAPFDPAGFGGVDLFGVDWFYDANAGGSMEKAPLLDAPDDLENWEELVVFPDLAKFDWEGCARANSEYLSTDKLLYTTFYSCFFERLISFVGFDNAAIALVDEEQQEYVHALFDRLADFYIEMGKYMHRWFGVEWIEIHDDWGTQRSIMFSVDTYKEMIAPYIRKVADGFHADGIIYEQHSCGFVEDLIPHLIAAGADTWVGQLNNDICSLCEKYGSEFKFGVLLSPGRPVGDGGAAEYVRSALEKYRGRNVWFSFRSPDFTPPQKEMIAGIFASAAP